jgi:hypothetical protein
MMGVMADEPTTAMCCGELPEGTADKPRVAACMLCPKSPTYWRVQPGVPERLETNPAALAEVYRSA